MSWTRHFAVAAILAAGLVQVAALARAQPPSAAQRGPGREEGEQAGGGQDATHRALLRVTYDPKVVALDNEAIFLILGSTRAVREGLEAALDRPITAPRTDDPKLEVGMLQSNAWVFEYWFEGVEQPVQVKLSPHLLAAAAAGDDSAMLIEVRVRIGENEPAVKWQSVVEGVRRGVLSVLSESAQAERVRRMDAKARAQQQFADAQHKLREIQERIGALQLMSGRPVLSREALLGELHEMQTQERSLEIELAAKHARRQRLEQQIAERARQVADDPNMQTIERELQSILELRKNELARLHAMAEKDLASSSDVNEARAVVSEAEVRLAQHRREAQRAAGAEALGAMNVELTHLAAETAEMEVRLAMLRKFVEELKGKPLQLAHEYEHLATIELPPVKQAMEMAQHRAAQAEDRLAELREPTVMVISPESH